MSVWYSEHAQLRMAQRNLLERDVEYTLRNGKECRRGGAIHCTLRSKDIPKRDRRYNDIRRLEGMTILISPKDSEIITIYFTPSNKEAYKNIRKKAKYDKKKILM